MRSGSALRRWASGWGYIGQGLSDEEVDGLARLLSEHLTGADLRREGPAPAPPAPPPRLLIPDALAAVCTSDRAARWLHALGRSYADTLAAFRGAAPAWPDVVAMPRTEHEVAAVLEWCAQVGAVAVPFGGGTSVVGGVNPPRGDRPVVTVQMRAMRRVLEVDTVSRAACIEAGAVGPDLEDQLRPHGLTLRFFPQSFELSTLGGWLATRAAGHYATGPVHIDDLVESISAVTPAGIWTSRRLPGSGAGPSPDRLLLGSEGILGVITHAWVRLQERPVHRAGGTVRFPDLPAAAAAVRALVQSGMSPANCRVLDPTEAMLSGAATAGQGHVLCLLGFESAAHPVVGEAEQALALLRDAGGSCPEGISARSPGDGPGQAGREDASAAWRRSFLRAPYLRDGLLSLGILSETFETAVTWERLDTLVDNVLRATEDAVREICGDGIVTCRFTHVYPDGAAPYFTVIAPARHGSEASQWAELKAAATGAVMATGGTVTHHHAVGRDHRPWYDHQRPQPFALALAAAKRSLDPRGVLNPGVLIDDDPGSR